MGVFALSALLGLTQPRWWIKLCRSRDASDRSTAVTQKLTDKQWIDVDLHVHSIVSNRPKEFMLRKIQTGECYTQPEKVY